MNIETKLLKKVASSKKEISQLNSEILKMALDSFSSLTPGGTYAQVMEVARAVEKRDRMQNLADEICRVMLRIPKGYRALIAAVYFKGRTYEELAQRFGVTVTTVYRKLTLARKLLKKQLNELSENDFPEVFCLVKEHRKSS